MAWEDSVLGVVACCGVSLAQLVAIEFFIKRQANMAWDDSGLDRLAYYGPLQF